MSLPRREFAAVLLLPLLATFCGCDKDAAPVVGNRTPRVVVVTVINPQQRELSQTTIQPATVYAFQQAEIQAKVSGYVESLHADIGDEVSATDKLAVLSVPELQKTKESREAEIKRLEAVEGRREAERQLAVAEETAAKANQAQAAAQIKQAMAQLQADKAERIRIETLVDNKSVAGRLLVESVKKHESSEAAKSAADSALVSAKALAEVAAQKIIVAQKSWDASIQETLVARKQLAEIVTLMEYATLTPRFSGVVTERNVDVGDLVRNVQTASDKPRKPLFVVSDLSRVRVHVAVPENDAPLVKKGAPALLRLRSLPGKLNGQVTRTSRTLDERTRTILVEVVLDNPENKLLPGMYGEMEITLKQKPKALVLPAPAVRYDSKGNASVYVLNTDNTVRIVPVATGIDIGDETEITTGLGPEDRVVGPTIGRLKSGQKVQVQPD